MVGLEVVEKMFWTNYDFIVMRPKRFYRVRSENTSRYMEPFPFAVAMFLLYQTVLIGAVRFISPFVDWDSIISKKLNIPNIPDASSLIVITAPFALFSFLFFFGLIIVGAKIMRQRLKARDALAGLCFAYATFSLMVAYIGISSFIIFLVGSMGGEATGIARPLHAGFQFLNLTLLLYTVGGAAAFGKTSFWSLLVGTVLAYISFFVLLILVALAFVALR
jgi:hypothetical protein